MKKDFSHFSIMIQKKWHKRQPGWYFLSIKNLNELYQNDDIKMHCYLREEFIKKKIREFSLRGGEGLPIWALFPNFLFLFLNMVWIIQKCKEIFVSLLGDPPLPI